MRTRQVILFVMLGALLSGGPVIAQQTDPYAWLEDVHGAKPLSWVAEQNKKSLGTLKADPRYQKNYDNILQVLDASDRIPYGSLDHGFVYNFWQDAKNPKGVWRRTSVADYAAAAPHWENLLDVDALAKSEKENWVFEGAECSPGQARCLIRLSRGGGDAVVIREYDLKARKMAADGFSLPEAKSDATYLNDDIVLFSTAKDGATKSGYARLVKEWRRGTQVGAARKIYDGEASDVGSSPSAFHFQGKSFGVVVRNVTFFETDYFAVTDGGVKKLPLPRSANLQGMALGGSTRAILTLRQDWPGGTERGGKTLKQGALISVALDDFLKTGKAPSVQALYTPDARGSVEQVGATGHEVFAAITENVVGSVRQFSFGDGDSFTAKDIALPKGGATGIITADAESQGTDAYFSYQGFLTPPTLYAYDSKRADAPKAIKSLPARFDASNLVTEQFEATSKDGTKIPYFVTRPKNLSGPAPTVLYGYGGFEISMTPSYSANFGRLWLTHGGIYVVANIRGGGEFGPAWHEAALKMNRQKAYDDFAAVAADIEKRGLTTPKQLGIMGGSNGGLLVSTVMTQIPDKLGAVVCQVPLIDMIAYTHIGAGASWVGEYGDPADARMRDYILTYSPYQNVKKGVKYPPVFFVTATSDDRVTPVHARKMAARMEEQGHDVLFYENTDGGHAAAADHKQAAEMWALSFLYLAQKLGLKN